MTAARLTCGNSAGYDGTAAPGCMPVCDACLQKWIDARPVAVADQAPQAQSFPDILEKEV